ncbi:cobalamin biosynthesis protein CobG, partial [Streptomyces sp. HNM0663]
AREAHRAAAPPAPPAPSGASSDADRAAAPHVGVGSWGADAGSGGTRAHSLGAAVGAQAAALPGLPGLPFDVVGAAGPHVGGADADGEGESGGIAAAGLASAVGGQSSSDVVGAAGPHAGGGPGGAEGESGGILAPAQRATPHDRSDSAFALMRIAGDSGAYRIAARHAARAALVVAEMFVEQAGGQAWRMRELPAAKAPSPGSLVPLLAGHGIEARYQSDVPASEGPAPDPGPVSGPDGRTALSLGVPLGRLTAAQWRQLAAAAREDGDGTLRLTPWRGVVLPGLAPAAAPARLAALAAAGLIVAPDDPRNGVSACAGRPGCARSLADVRADAAAATASAGGGLPIHFSGCERRCGHPRGRWTDVLATPDGYRVAAPDGPVHHGVTTAELAGALAAARTTPSHPVRK